MDKKDSEQLIIMPGAGFLDSKQMKRELEWVFLIGFVGIAVVTVVAAVISNTSSSKLPGLCSKCGK